MGEDGIAMAFDGELLCIEEEIIDGSGSSKEEIIGGGGSSKEEIIGGGGSSKSEEEEIIGGSRNGEKSSGSSEEEEPARKRLKSKDILMDYCPLDVKAMDVELWEKFYGQIEESDGFDVTVFPVSSSTSGPASGH
ncbi:hypothetical protein ACH5RR_000112 [Cinchona calisaya]|uniref:Uncharacterized protein n=1 Tax=Cinchona calisaya TaxID=153742 RepID=A0ABD3AZX4_9GENT